MIICEEVVVAANEGELIDQGRMPSICVEVEGILGQGTKGGDRRVTRGQACDQSRGCRRKPSPVPRDTPEPSS